MYDIIWIICTVTKYVVTPLNSFWLSLIYFPIIMCIIFKMFGIWYNIKKKYRVHILCTMSIIYTSYTYIKCIKIYVCLCRYSRLLFMNAVFLRSRPLSYFTCIIFFFFLVFKTTIYIKISSSSIYYTHTPNNSEHITILHNSRHWLYVHIVLLHR